MRFRSVVFSAAIIFLASVCAQAGSAVLLYQSTPLGGNLYRYTYSISNNAALGLGVPIRGFDIFFDPLLYQEGSLSVVTSAPLSTQWSEQIFFSVPPLPAAYDALALAAGIPDGSTVSGFAVQFNWLGSGTPGAQPFEIYSPDTFQVLASGATGGPEPSTLCLLGIALACGAWKVQSRGRKTRKHFRASGPCARVIGI